MISLNPNYYRLFTLKSPGQDLLPLRSEEKAQLDSVGGQHMEAVKQSHVKDEEKLLHCKSIFSEKVSPTEYASHKTCG
jgi:hypothetical protein